MIDDTHFQDYYYLNFEGKNFFRRAKIELTWKYVLKSVPWLLHLFLRVGVLDVVNVFWVDTCTLRQLAEVGGVLDKSRKGRRDALFSVGGPWGVELAVDKDLETVHLSIYRRDDGINDLQI